jgi:hypothetical protein
MLSVLIQYLSRYLIHLKLQHTFQSLNLSLLLQQAIPQLGIVIMLSL